MVTAEGFPPETGVVSADKSHLPPSTGAQLHFPCEVDIKVFVKAVSPMGQRLHSLLLQHLPPEQVLGIRRKESRNGKYHSLSCRVLARERKELDQIYLDLSDHPDILLAL